MTSTAVAIDLRFAIRLTFFWFCLLELVFERALRFMDFSISFHQN